MNFLIIWRVICPDCKRNNNASIRLFEAFMMGRIPVIINSDMILPFEDQIDYRKNTVFITDFRDIDFK